MPPLLPRLTHTLSLPAALWLAALLLSACSEGDPQRSGEAAKGVGGGEATVAVGRQLQSGRGEGSLAEPPTLDDRTLIAPDLLALIDGAADDVRRSPDSLDAWLELGLLYDANAMGQLAVTAYERAVALAPDDHRPAYHLARVLEQTGQTERAIQTMSAVLAWARDHAPDHAPGHGRLSSWLLEAGDLKAARTAYACCRELDPTGLRGTLGLARVGVAISDAETAVTLLEPLRDRHPQMGELRFLQGSAYRLQGRLDAAHIELASWDGQPAPFFAPWESAVARHTAGYQALLGQAGRRGTPGRSRSSRRAS
ncbi:MAG: tetratricopeptide (TPR) repeat protein [Pseudohongiellaceae bacterium]|jgi:tetratricopeptide (TPR) repeat protein